MSNQEATPDPSNAPATDEMLVVSSSGPRTVTAFFSKEAGLRLESRRNDDGTEPVDPFEARTYRVVLRDPAVVASFSRWLRSVAAEA